MESTQNLIYLYDLPKSMVSSVKIAEAIKNYCGVQITVKPQIKRDVSRPFYTAIVNVPDPNNFQKVSQAFKYFEIEKKPCRALPFDKQLLGSNREKLSQNNIFVKFQIERFGQINHEQLNEIFIKYGQIKSVKVSMNSNYEPIGYGFVCYQNEQGAINALNSKPEGFEVLSFKPKDAKKALRKIVNNIYVKNIPLDYDDNKVRDLFAPFGHIKSLVLQKNDIGQFGFVCYEDPNLQDKEYGPKCAFEAIEALNGREENGQKLIVKHALSKQERIQEKLRNLIRYKISKKRCNLYVKNFPKTWSEQNIKDIFSHYGEIERVRLGEGKGNTYAFVCYKEPNDAAKAKQNLHNQTFDGKTLLINYYEIKEFKQLQNEEAIDQADWERYLAQLNGGLNWNQLTSQPHLAQMLQSLLQIIQTNEQMNQQMDRNNNQRPRNSNRNQYPRNNMRQQQQINQNQMNNQQIGDQQQYMNMQQNQRMPQAPQPPMAPPMPQIAQIQPPINPQMMSVPQRYMFQAQKLLPAVSEKNPYLKDQVGQCIFEYIVGICGQERAPKITGMLIELPIQQIKNYLSSYDALYMKVQEANEHLTNAMAAAQPQ